MAREAGTGETGRQRPQWSGRIGMHHGGRHPHLDFRMSSIERRESPVSTEASEMVTVPRAEWDSLQAEVRRLRREAGDRVALERIKDDSGPGPGDRARMFTRSELAEAWGITE